MFGLMSVKKHKAVVAIVKDERDAYAASYSRTHDALSSPATSGGN